jgi:hypothetical protein
MAISPITPPIISKLEDAVPPSVGNATGGAGPGVSRAGAPAELARGWVGVAEARAEPDRSSVTAAGTECFLFASPAPLGA